jgi:hypothetical protein
MKSTRSIAGRKARTALLTWLVLLCGLGVSHAQQKPQVQVSSAERGQLPIEVREPNEYLFGQVLSPYAEDVMKLDRYNQAEPIEISKSIVAPILDADSLVTEGRGLGLNLSLSSSASDFSALGESFPPEWDQALYLASRDGHAPGSGLPGGWQGTYFPHLTTAVTFDLAGEHPAELRLLRIDPLTWDKMDNWEKIGYVTKQAAGIAGMLVILAEILN